MDPNTRYVIRFGTKDDIDYNGDGVINEHDQIVEKWVKAAKGWKRESVRVLTHREILGLESKFTAVAPTPNTTHQAQTKMVYHKLPSPTAANPPLVAVQDKTEFGQFVKAGAGMAVGELAVESVFDALTGMFSSGGVGQGHRRLSHYDAMSRYFPKTRSVCARTLAEPIVSIKLTGLHPNATFFHFAAKKGRDGVLGRDAAYGKLPNSYVARASPRGEAIITMERPQLYVDVDGEVYPRHFHFVYWKGGAWEAKVHTHRLE
jgi:hypothetical protein